MFVESTSIAAANSLHDIKVHRDRRVCFENASALDFRRVIFLGPFLFLFIHSGVLGPNVVCTKSQRCHVRFRVATAGATRAISGWSTLQSEISRSQNTIRARVVEIADYFRHRAAIDVSMQGKGRELK
jgi:hypothetical protein